MLDLCCNGPRVENDVVRTRITHDGDFGLCACSRDDATTVEQGGFGEGGSSETNAGGASSDEKRMCLVECEGIEGPPRWIRCVSACTTVTSYEVACL